MAPGRDHPRSTLASPLQSGTATGPYTNARAAIMRRTGDRVLLRPPGGGRTERTSYRLTEVSIILNVWEPFATSSGWELPTASWIEATVAALAPLT